MRKLGRKTARRCAAQSAHPVTDPEVRYAVILLILKEEDKGHGLKPRKLKRLLEDLGVKYDTTRKLAQDLINLGALGLVEAYNPYGGPGSRRYRLTLKGHKAVEKIEAYMNRGAPREEYTKYLERLFERAALGVM